MSGFDSNEMDTLPRPAFYHPAPPLPAHLRRVFRGTQARCCKTGCPGTPGTGRDKIVRKEGTAVTAENSFEGDGGHLSPVRDTLTLAIGVISERVN